jgi:hypothetical protein
MPDHRSKLPGTRRKASVRGHHRPYMPRTRPKAYRGQIGEMFASRNFSLRRRPRLKTDGGCLQRSVIDGQQKGADMPSL